MNIELISSLARTHRDELLAEAARRRLLCIGTSKRPLRSGLARAVRAMGYAALTLGDALAGTR